MTMRSRIASTLSSKTYVTVLMSAIMFFIIFNLLIWNFFTKELFSEEEYVRCDLARIAYAPHSRELRKFSIDLPKRHISFTSYHFEPIDMLTVGDSFAEGLSQGRNPFFQDYIATINNFRVLHLSHSGTGSPLHGENFIDNIHTLLNSGFFDRVKTRYVLIESAEKDCIDRFSQKIDRQRVVSLDAYFGWLQNRRNAPEPKIGCINNGNFKFIFYNLLYNFSDNAFTNSVYKAKLTQDFFSVADPATLLFHKFDIQHVHRSTPSTVIKLNDNLNELAHELLVKGITLVFMPCADKYNLYSEYIIDNTYPVSSFFESLRKLPKEYVFVDTKAILSEELKKGVKDVYLADDTHWSWKAAEKIFTTVRFTN